MCYRTMTIFLAMILGIMPIFMNGCAHGPNEPKSKAQSSSSAQENENMIESGDSKTDEERDAENAAIRMRIVGNIAFDPKQHPSIAEKEIGQGQYVYLSEFVDKRDVAPEKHVGTLYNLLYHAPVSKFYISETINLAIESAIASLLSANGFILQKIQDPKQNPIIVKGTINKIWVGLHHSIYGEIDVDIKIINPTDSKTLWSGKIVKSKDISAPKGAGYGVLFGVMGDGTELEPFLNELLAEAIIEAWNNAGMKDALRKIGKEFAKKESTEESIVKIKSSKSIENDAKSNFEVGFGYYKIGSFDEARKYLEKACQLEPQWARAHYQLGITYMKVGNKDLAISQYEALKKLDENYAKRLFDEIYKD